MNGRQDAILLIYTGGTIGMMNNPSTNSLVPVDFSEIANQLPELKRFEFRIDTHTFHPAIDSSDANPEFWGELVDIIKSRYEEYDGFVILHGTDTMAYSASALSFMLDNLQKPVIFTGSQLPIGVLRTDGKENLISAIEIAADCENAKPIVPEVCIFFQNYLYRGNRTLKSNAEFFNAFKSYNYPPLAETGISIKYNNQAILRCEQNGQLLVSKSMDTRVGIIKLFPGMTQNWIKQCFNSPDIRAFVIETFGNGNATTSPWFMHIIEETIGNGKLVFNVTQCHTGSVNPGVYESSRRLHELGVVNGRDITVETAVTKLMYLLGSGHEMDKTRILLNKSLRGEITI